ARLRAVRAQRQKWCAYLVAAEHLQGRVEVTRPIRVRLVAERAIQLGRAAERSINEPCYAERITNHIVAPDFDWFHGQLPVFLELLHEHPDALADWLTRVELPPDAGGRQQVQ